MKISYISNPSEIHLTIKKLEEPNIGYWLFNVLFNWVEIIIIFIFLASVEHWVLHILGIIVLGTRQHALALIGHEALHFHLSKKKYKNFLFGNWLAGYPILQDLKLFSPFHINHHVHLMEEDNDPEISYRRHSGFPWKLPITPIKRVILVVWDCCGLGLWEIFHALRYILPRVPLNILFRPLLFWIPITLIFMKLNLIWVIQYWLLAYFTIYWACFRQRALTEHLATDKTHKLTANLLQRFLYLPHYTWLHYEHHINSKIPSWHLKEFRHFRERMGGDKKPVKKFQIYLILYNLQVLFNNFLNISIILI